MWTYNDQPFAEPGEQDYGFVYIIENLITGKKYIGNKLFWFKKTRQVKGKKKREYEATLTDVAYFNQNGEMVVKRI